MDKEKIKDSGEVFGPSMKFRIKVLRGGNSLGEDEYAFMVARDNPAYTRHAKPAKLQQAWTGDKGSIEWRNIEIVFE